MAEVYLTQREDFSRRTLKSIRLDPRSPPPATPPSIHHGYLDALSILDRRHSLPWFNSLDSAHQAGRQPSHHGTSRKYGKDYDHVQPVEGDAIHKRNTSTLWSRCLTEIAFCNPNG
jgi:hypothetical protein